MTDLPKIVTKRDKRVGRGYGSGKGGHTTGRGQKGQKARGGVSILFEGMKVKKSLIKRLPFRRGKDKLKAADKPVIIKLGALELLSSGSTVNVDILIKEGIVNASDAKKFGVKILGDGKISKKLNISVPISKSAAKLVEQAGGKILK
ncbi:50S ribosomal protein L15 [Patescibacteria group bacterium]|nr:50S ribosomal protein L15 [Patescibacteria group bacterium]